MSKKGTGLIVLPISLGLLLLAGAIFYLSKRKSDQREISTAVEVVKTWALPGALKEISGIAFLDANRVACVQDEDGFIYIYNLETSAIENRIEFAGPGDYEGIAVNGTTAYVLESNGSIFIVRDFMQDPKVDRIDTKFCSKNNPEGIFYDEEKNRLLLALKSRDPNSNGYKGIYSYDLETRELLAEPVLKMTFEEKIFDGIRKKNAQRTFFPSDINRNPHTGDFLILEAENPRLLVIAASGEAKQLHVLDRGLFPKPEGLAFNETGKLYISNEGNPATLHEVVLK